jgi:hypothetical protein
VVVSDILVQGQGQRGKETDEGNRLRAYKRIEDSQKKRSDEKRRQEETRHDKRLPVLSRICVFAQIASPHCT